MTASFEFGVEENVEAVLGDLGVDDARPHRQDVGVIVLPGQTRRQGIVAQGATANIPDKVNRKHRHRFSKALV